ncbi:MAG: peptidoglycan-binding protein [Silicimonas sp.]|nr:peptidoglycan-binding protein [Silicimonas sp.]
MRSALLITIAVCATLPVAALAQTTALLLGTEDYDRVSDVRRGDEIADAAGDLDRAGVRVVARQGADLDDMRQALSEFGQMAGASDRVLIALGGRFLHSATETYYLPSDADTGPLATLAANTLPLSTVLAWLAEKPGDAILILGTDDLETEYDTYLAAGLGDFAIPQGVTVVIGDPRPAARFIEDRMTRPGTHLVAAARAAGLSVSGFMAPGLVFVTEDARPDPTTATPPANVETDADVRLRDIRGWREADDANTAEAYQSYLRDFPNGEFRRMAENRIQSLTDTPEARAERTEQSLDLNRDQRREIQRDLSLLDYNTRGIDGIFGRGTRTAIAAWQQSEGFDGSGYLTSDQITRLDAQAERRAAELEAEAERRRAQQLAQDRAFWDETGSLGDEAGLRAYLGRFPDGEFSEDAREQLAAIELQKRRETDARDRQLWDEATQENTSQSYRDYLELAPGGAFRDEAETRIAALEQAGQNSGAAREEQALNLSPRTRQIIESRLEALDLRPGNVDGVLDDDSRRAIRRYQAARNLPETGYLSERVVVQLLADSVRQIFR